MAHRKLNHYADLFKRIQVANTSSHPLEAIWYAYALIEDRLRSILLKSGGASTSAGTNIIGLGKKLTAVKKRRMHDKLLSVYFDQTLMTDIRKWATQRNGLIHAMADASTAMPAIDQLSLSVAKEGTRLSYILCRQTRLLTRNRAKIPAPKNPYMPKK